MATKFFIVSLIERTFKIIYKILLLIFHIFPDSCNILTESNELETIIEVLHVTSQVKTASLLSWQPVSIWTRNSFLVVILNLEVTQNVLNNFWLLLSHN